MSNTISFQPTREVYLKPYSTRELADLYGVTYKTFLVWLKPFRHLIGKKHGRLLTIPQVKIIFENLDYPTMSLVKMSENNPENRS